MGEAGGAPRVATRPRPRLPTAGGGGCLGDEGLRDPHGAGPGSGVHQLYPAHLDAVREELVPPDHRLDALGQLRLTSHLAPPAGPPPPSPPPPPVRQGALVRRRARAAERPAAALARDDPAAREAKHVLREVPAGAPPASALTP